MVGEEKILMSQNIALFIGRCWIKTLGDETKEVLNDAYKNV
jgi:hypothetical protein